jgi:hypothetical protein
MEFWYKNFLQTTTSIVVDNNTAGSVYMMSTDTKQQWVTTGLGDDNTTTTIRINFDSTQTVSRIGLMNINWREFYAYYNGATASVLALTTTSATTTVNYTSNSATSLCFQTTPTACTSVSFAVKKTIVANSEKALGWVCVSNQMTDFDGRVPSAKDYKITLDPLTNEHKMSDGGTRIHYVRDVYTADIKLEHISSTLQSSLKTAFDLHDEFVFAPFPTTTSWDTVLIPCVWIGNFEFLNYSENATVSGYSGAIKLRQVSV